MKRAFLIADKVLYQAAHEWLENSAFVCTRAAQDTGIAVYEADDSRVVLVDPKHFSMAVLGVSLREALRDADELKILSPSIIQYFASGMDVDHSIFKAIDKLSDYIVAIQDAPVFRMLHDKSGDQFKHQVIYGSFPKSFRSVKTSYVDADGRTLSARELGLPKKVKPVAVPLVFFHSGFTQQRFTRTGLVRLKNKDYKYERMAFDELMLRFPSREPREDELKKLITQLDMPLERINDIWDHNRRQWNEVRQKLELLGCTMPGPTADEKNPAFDQFTHLAVSGAGKIVEQLEIYPKSVRHIGIPLFARNGVTIPLGVDGIVERGDDFTARTLHDRISKFMPIALNARFGVEIRNNGHDNVVESVMSA